MKKLTIVFALFFSSAIICTDYANAEFNLDTPEKDNVNASFMAEDTASHLKFQLYGTNKKIAVLGGRELYFKGKWGQYQTFAKDYVPKYLYDAGIAFSAFSHDEGDFDDFARISVDILNKLWSFTRGGQIWNVNFPDFGVEIKGRKFTPLGSKVYVDEYVFDGDGKCKLFGVIDEKIEFCDCDVYWNRQGYVTVTPLKYDKSDYETLKNIGEKCII